jgi:hypothetical protein
LWHDCYNLQGAGFGASQFSIFETRAEGNSKQSKIFLDFSNFKPKIANKANQS